MHSRTVFFVSDGTGITAETFGNAILAQFEFKPRHVRLPFIDNAAKADEAVTRINHQGLVDGRRPIVFSTLVNPQINEIVRTADALFLDLIATFVGRARPRFAQIAGFRFTYSVAANPGSRVLDVILDDGTVLVDDGVVLNPKLTLSAATIDFLCRGGDEYPLNGLSFETVGVSYQQALFNFVTAKDGLNGVIRAVDYPVGGEGRIVRYTPSASFRADINGDSVVNALDLAILFGNWGLTGSNRAGDVNGDLVVNANDLTIVLVNWTN